MKANRHLTGLIPTAFAAVWLLLFASPIPAATFTNNASLVLTTNEPTLSLTSTSGVFSVSCWFKLNVPSTLSLSQNMTLFMDRADGNEAANHSFQIRVNYVTGALEFTSRGNAGAVTNKLSDGLFVGRWYHLAVTRSGSSFNAYLDGQPASQFTANVGTTTGLGFGIGGINGPSRQFYGEIIELSIYNTELVPDEIGYMMFADQRVLPNPPYLRAYYKLGFLPGGVDNFTNYVASPPAGTSPIPKVGTGVVTFPELDQSGEQSLFDSRVNGGQNAVAPLSGVFSWQESAISRPTPGIAFDFRYAYSGAIPNPPSGANDPYFRRALGNGWRHSFDVRVTASLLDNGGGKEIRIISWDGAIESWTQTNGAYAYQTRHGEYRGDLKELPFEGNKVEWMTPERLIYRFNAPGGGPLDGRLSEVREPNGNKLTLFWNNSGFLTNVVDSAGGVFVFNYSGNYLTNVSFGPWQVKFTYDTTNRLASQSFTNTSGAYTNVATTWQFYYTNIQGFSLLDRVVDPRGFTNTVVTYDKYRRKIRIADALNRASTFEYGVPDNRTIRMTDPENFQHLTTYDRKGRVVSDTDPLGNVNSYTYDAAGHRTSITEPLGYTTWFGYDNRGNMTARTNFLGEITRWNYHTNFNRPVSEINNLGWTNYFRLDDATGSILAQYDGLGLISTNVYATNGLLLSSTDARGFTTYFTNDANGFLIGKRDAAANVTTYTYNELGWKLSERNALGQEVTYAYNLGGNVVRTVDPLLRVYTKTFDANGNVLSESDAKGSLTTYNYDLANQKTNMVDRTGTNIWRYFYSARGNLTNTLSPINVGVTNFYDAANRLTQISAPLGNTIQNQYDRNGNLTNMVDQLGRNWRKTYDQLNRVVAEVDPQGDTKLTEYDPVGRVKKTTSPKGYSSVNEYDDRGRLSRWTDPEGFQWQYDYDANANITNITDALGGHYVMAYSNRNERILERNQDGKEWHYVYDILGRLKQQTDPNGTTRTLDYDDGGRVLSVTFNTGRVNSFAYDDNNNPEVLSRSGSGPATLNQLRYDVLDRVTEYTDAFNKKIKYQYDALGRRSVLTYPDNKTLTYQYDVLSRLTNQMDWAGRQLTYQYDTASRLVRRTYPNGVVQTNAFDETGQLTNLTYSVTNAVPPTNAINIALSYAYDRNGNKTASEAKGTFDWPIPAKRSEKATYTPAGRLIDREINIPSSTNPQPATVTYAYDPSGNLTNAAGNGQAWALAYDEDNRTTRISWDCGITHKDITNRYDAMGRRIAMTVDGVESRFALDLAAGMERILCDLAPNGQILAYYIHGPDLSYKVTPGANETVTCYHADAQANIIALTGTGGTNAAQYAYTPYGRSLGSTNCDPSTLNSQPYTFVGSQGVMEELPGLYFMRARYYSAECGVFLSTDPVKPIGPGWRPNAYGYAGSNPLMLFDPSGNSWEFIKDASFSAQAALGLGGSGSVTLNPGNSTSTIEQIGGFGASAGFGVDLASYRDGSDDDWEDYTSRRIDVPFFGVEFSKSSTGKRGFSISFNIGPGMGYFAYDTSAPRQEKVVTWDAPDISPITSVTTIEPPSNGGNTSQVKQNVGDANEQANKANQQTTATGNNGSGKGGSIVNPMRDYYADKAAANKKKYKSYKAMAAQHYGSYQQASASQKELMASFSNSDYFNYFVMAQQAKQMADQAYAQYQNSQRQADRAYEQFKKNQEKARNSN